MQQNAQPVFVRSFWPRLLGTFTSSLWWWPYLHRLGCLPSSSLTGAMRLPPLQLLTSQISPSFSVCVRQDICLPSSSPIACICEAICLSFIFLHDLLSSSLNPAKVLVISLPISLAFYVLPQIRAQVTHHPLPSELAMHRVHGPWSPMR